MNLNRAFVVRAAAGLLLCLSLSCAEATQIKPKGVEALIYCTMPSTREHSPDMAMDGNMGTSFQSTGGMDDGDDFLVLLSQPIPVTSIEVATGDADGNDVLANAFVETSRDGITYSKAATFDRTGVAKAAINGQPVMALRIRMNPRRGAPKLVIREITVNSSVPITHVQYGPGRGFYDISQAPDLAKWAATAEKQMESFWPDTAAMLYSYGLITPNMVNVIYKTGPGVTGVAATGGGVMTVNSAWCRGHADDTGLTVHEMAHVVQSIQASAPGWLIEGTADYIRWIKFEPEHFTPRINVNRATYHDAYRTSATFLAWCSNHYDSQIVTKLNDAARSGNYKNALFVKYCGKDVDTLWSEFIAAYKADPTHILQLPMPPAMAPRLLPEVKAGTSVPVNISPLFNLTGTSPDGVHFSGNGGFDGGGAAYPSKIVSGNITWKNVQFRIGSEGWNNVAACHGGKVTLPSGMHKSLWILASAIEGSHKEQTVTVTYADGSVKHFEQNFSDWYVPEKFPGESRAVRADYRNMADGTKDMRTFYVYSYGFELDSSKSVKSVTLPDDDQIRVLAISVAD